MTRALTKVCHKLLQRPAMRVPPVHVRKLADFWPENFFRLPQLSFWATLDDSVRHQVREGAALLVMHEALGIERTAMDYCAQRVIRSTDPVEKQVYSLTAAEEARHYHALSALLDARIVAMPGDAFTQFLEGIVATATPNVQSYLLQVILEGWGIGHYQRLAEYALDTDVKAVMLGIAKDEALHYAGGVAHFAALKLDDAERAYIREALVALCTMVASGPLGLLKVLEEACGGFDLAKRRQVFEVLSDRTASDERLRQLAGYIAHDGMESECAWLDQQGLFRTLPAEDALRYYALS